MSLEVKRGRRSLSGFHRSLGPQEIVRSTLGGQEESGGRVGSSEGLGASFLPPPASSCHPDPQDFAFLVVEAQLALSAPIFSELMLEKPELTASSPDSPGRLDKEA